MAADADSVQRLLQPGDNDRDAVKMELLAELQGGRPLRDLRPVLTASDTDVVRAGVWIASELGAAGRPLLDAVTPLLAHPDPFVRFFALDCVLNWASRSDSAALGAAAAGLEDESEAVRWKTARVLAQASAEQLAAARAGARTERHACLLAWLLGDDARSGANVIHQLDGRDPLARRYGAIAAARLAPTHREPLEHAAQSTDKDVHDFAADTLALK